jgi:hypothetical protein
MHQSYVVRITTCLTEPVPQTSVEIQGSAKCIVVEFGGSGRKWPNVGWLQLQRGGAQWSVTLYISLSIVVVVIRSSRVNN